MLNYFLSFFYIISPILKELTITTITIKDLITTKNVVVINAKGIF